MTIRKSILTELHNEEVTASNEVVYVACYNWLEVWSSRTDAINFYAEGAAFCDGSEAARYANIVSELSLGSEFATDGTDELVHSVRWRTTGGNYGSEDYVKLGRMSAEEAYNKVKSGEVTRPNLTEGVETEAGNDLEEVAAYMYQDAYYQVENIPTYNEVNDYIASVTKKEYNTLYKMVEKACRVHEEHSYAYDYNDDYIELNDNHTIWELHSDTLTDEDWWSIVDSKVAAFKGETGVDLYLVGRSGRHACVDNTFYNAMRFEELQAVQERLEREAIEEFNGGGE